MYDVLRPTLAVLGIAAALSAQTLVADIEPGRTPGQTTSSPQPFGVVAGRLLFAAHGGERVGRELYSTDGTPQGTHLVRSIGPGAADGIPFQPVPLDDVQPAWLGNGLVFFPADDGVHGLELWCSDGTANGTRLVADLRAGAQTSSPTPLAVVGGRLLFTADDGVHGREPWISDGTADGTLRLADIAVGPASSLAANAVVVGTHAYFAAEDATRDRELWRTDGTPAGTHRVVDLVPGPSGSIPRPLCAHGNELLFVAVTPAYGAELWRTDGTAVGTQLVRDLTPGPFDTTFFGAIHVGGRSFIAARGVFMLDANGLHPIGQVPGDRAHFAACGNGVLVVGHKLIQREVWWTDGTTSRRLLQADPNAFTFGAPAIPFGGGALFAWQMPSSGTQLWFTDGTVAGTRMLDDGNFPPNVAGPLLLFPFAHQVVFQRPHPRYGRELWITDGTGAGTRLVADIDSGIPAASSPSRFVRLADRLLFRTRALGLFDDRVFVTDGTTNGTFSLAAAPYGADPYAPWALVIGDRALFASAENVATTRLMLTDGTLEGTHVMPVPGHRVLLGTIGDRFAYQSFGTNADSELTVSDGTPDGTTQIEINPGRPGVRPRSGANVGDLLFFTADDGTHGEELFVTDGTQSGTRMPLDIEPGVRGSEPSTLVASDTFVWFGARTTQHGYELWRSDGTTAGTHLVVDLLPGPSHGLGEIGATDGRRFVDAAATLGDVLLFPAAAANDPTRFGWWTTDGTAAGTSQLTFGPSSIAASTRGSMRRVGDVVYWSTEVERGTARGAILAVSDGTAAGTRVLLHGPDGSKLTAVDAADGRSRRALFALQTPTEGSELWITDGTVAGTQPFGRGLPGPASGASGELARLGNAILLAADDGVTGMELYAMPAGDAGIAAVDTFGSACPSGVAPTFTANGAPTIGASLTLAIDGARVLAPGALLFGARTDLPLGPCRVLVLPSVALGIVTDATGATRIPLTIPSDASLVGALAHTQSAIADPAGVLGVVALGNGLALLFGR